MTGRNPARRDPPPPLSSHEAHSSNRGPAQLLLVVTLPFQDPQALPFLPLQIFGPLTIIVGLKRLDDAGRDRVVLNDPGRWRAPRRDGAAHP